MAGGLIPLPILALTEIKSLHEAEDKDRLIDGRRNALAVFD